MSYLRVQNVYMLSQLFSVHKNPQQHLLYYFLFGRLFILINTRQVSESFTIWYRPRALVSVCGIQRTNLNNFDMVVKQDFPFNIPSM